MDMQGSCQGRTLKNRPEKSKVSWQRLLDGMMTREALL